MRNGTARRAAWGMAFVLVAHCGPSDPLEEVRVLQEEQGNFVPTLELLRGLIEERPDDPEIQYRYGVALLATGQPSLALWPLLRAAESREWGEHANLALASAYLATGSHDRAIQVADREVERAPESVPARLLRANARIQSRRDYEGALEDAERVLEIDPDNADALVPRAIALLALERVEEAARAIEDLESQHRDAALGLHGSPGYCTARAKFAQEKGDLELAEERYTACLAQFPANSSLVGQALDFFDARGERERSNEILRAALESMPEVQTIRLALASRLRAQEREEEALEVLREGTEHEDPLVAAESWAGLARFRIDAGDYEGGVAAYREVRRLAGADDLLLFNAADALVMAGRPDEALALADEISQEAYRELVRGRAELARGEHERALEHFQRGIRLWPNNPYARYYSARAAEEHGDFERAIEDYRYAMRIDVRATDAYLRLARLQEAAGRLEDALATLRFLATSRPQEPEAALQELRLLARRGGLANAPPRLLRGLAEPVLWAAAAAAVADGVAERSGAAAAVEAIRGMEGLDLRDPRQAPALGALVEQLAANGEARVALAEVDRALAAQPEAAVFSALRGRALELGGRPGESRAAFERALVLDPEQPLALLGLARRESEGGDHEAALALYRRALALDPPDPAAARGAAAALAALDRKEEAEALLADELSDHPYDAEIALALARLRLARGAADERTRALARRALLFGGGEAAERLLERTGSAGGEPREAGAGAS